MPLRLLFPLACPLPPLLRLPPTPAGARFYSPSRLATSLVTPTSRRPINRHRLLSKTYIPNQASHTKPTIEEIKKWDEDDLLEWIRQKLPIYVEDAFQSGIRYAPPDPLVSTSGVDWVYQPHPDLYETLAENVLEQYAHWKRDEIDKTYIPTYYYLGGAGTGKSRHASEFASSVQKAITLHTQHPLYHELAQRLKTAFVFHVSFESGTPLMAEEMSDPWKAIGTRMLHQLLGKPIDYIHNRYDADPAAIFRLVAAAEKVDLYGDFTGILVIDGLQKAFPGYDDGGMNKSYAFYGLLGQINALSLMSRSPSEAKALRVAPFIMTCVTATCFGPVQNFIADAHRRRVYLPINRLDTPTWKKDNSPVLNDSPVTRLFVNDVGGHARAIEIIADELAKYQNGVQPNITELANAIYAKLRDRYREAVSVLQRHALSVVQCVLSRQQIHPGDVIPGSDLRWEHVTASGLIRLERTEKDYFYYEPGYLVVPYIWLWMLARLSPSKNTERLCQFLRNWQFNDYAELLHLATGEGRPGNTTWQSFEAFCCSFRILRSLGFEDGQEVPLKLLHSGCKLRDDQKTMVVNRYLDAGAQLSHAILNAPSAPAGDFFFNIKTSAQRSPNEKGSQGNVVREVGRCKLIQKKKLTRDTYDAERKKCAGPDDIFMLYTDTEISDDFALPDRSGLVDAERKNYAWPDDMLYTDEISDDFVLPDRSGLVDASCWDSYFGPFAGRAYMASQYGAPKDVTKK